MTPTQPEDWILGTNVRIKEEAQGALLLDDGIVMGYRAGPSSEMSNLLHEFGHFIETPEDRLLYRNWGLWLHSEGYGPMPKTPQASLRELRVYGMQKVLCDYMNVSWDIQEACHSLSFMPDWHHIEVLFGERYGELRTPSKPLSDKMVSYVLKEAEKHTPESLFIEFRRRCAIHDASFPRAS